ncbi:MAG: DUF1579 domain-containing protein [Planctomycetes bacterium]|nr:DUF1579 domain-containing protein [Planctomycetota bacterium]
MKLPLLAAALSFVLAPVVSAQEGKEPPAGQQGEMPKPGKEHQRLAAMVGTWDATMEMAGMPASKGVSTITMTLGGFWLVDQFVADIGGMPFEGRGTTGYDPIKGKHVATWVDCWSSGLTVTEGSYDEKTKTLTMTGDGYDQMGQKVKVKHVTTHKDANTNVFEMFQTGADGKEVKLMTVTYVRRK